MDGKIESENSVLSLWLNVDDDLSSTSYCLVDIFQNLHFKCDLAQSAWAVEYTDYVSAVR